ncbi:tetratricopeptide repeat protein [Psychromonas sp. KJ10-10]|uniref:tetratricopeptide repeat protein n=1 Tax=Psychromonas sp. KJ10-10 TaxID=3391823 RepID=UPI0039B4C233
MYSNGLGVLQDYKKATNWYRKAAEQGDADAQFSLGVMYNNGRGVLQDYKQAVNWYRKVTEPG